MFKIIGTFYTILCLMVILESLVLLFGDLKSKVSMKLHKSIISFQILQDVSIIICLLVFGFRVAYTVKRNYLSEY